MTTTESKVETKLSTGTRRFGYLVAIVINAVFLFVANNVLEWGWFSWLTDDFEQVLGLVNISLGFGILLNVIYMSFDAAWFKSLTQMVSNGISMVLAIRMYQVFPFDFSAYDFPWTTLARVVLIIGIVGTAIAIIVELVKFVKYAQEGA